MILNKMNRIGQNIGHLLRWSRHRKRYILLLSTEIIHNIYNLVFESTGIGCNGVVLTIDPFKISAAKSGMFFPYFDHVLDGMPKRIRVILLIFNIDLMAAINIIIDDRYIDTLRWSIGKASIGAVIPLHRCAHTVAVMQPNVISHSDFITVVDDGRARQGEKKRVSEHDLAVIVIQQGCQTTTDAKIQAHTRIGSKFLPHPFAFFFGDHFQCEFVVVAQEHAPLVSFGQRGRASHDPDELCPIFLANTHIDTGHDRKMETHVEFISPIPEIGNDIFRPLIGLCQQDTTGVMFIDEVADFFQKCMRFRQVFTTSVLTFK